MKIKAKENSEEYKKARYHYLLQVIYGETLAINYCNVMSEFAPNKAAKDFLLKQQIDEDRHLEALTDYMNIPDRPEVKVSKHMGDVHKVMEKALKEKDYAGSILVQNFIAEGLVIILLQEMSKHGDAQLKELCESINQDEVSHLKFGVDEIKKMLKEDTDGKLSKRLASIQRKVLFHGVLLFADLALEAKHLGIKWDELADKVLEDHYNRIKEANFHIPWYDKAMLKIAIWFFVTV
jgi:1,2-phenylacetyl-CoA epoxidase catalytic subunit